MRIASISDTPEFVDPNTDPHVSVAGISLLTGGWGTGGTGGKRGAAGEGGRFCEVGASDSTGGHMGRVSGCGEGEVVKGEVGRG